ncbi:MAG: DMT family transporter [Acutalibacter sp.]|nr:DMT family transporter [Acutalibacter sp.]
MGPKRFFPLLLLALIWGSYYVASQKAIERLSVFEAGVFIRLIALILLGAIMVGKGQLRLLFQVGKAWKRLLLIGLLGFLLDLTAFIGLSLSPAGSGTALLKCDILFVNLISVCIYKEKFTRADWCCAFVMLGGVFLILDVNPFHLWSEGIGSLFFVLSAFFVSVNAFLIKSVQTDQRTPIEDNVIAFYNNFVTLLLFVTVSLITGGYRRKFDLQLPETAIPVLSAGVGQTLIYLVYYYNLRRHPVWLVKIFLLLMPIVSLLICLVLFSEVPKVSQSLGIVVILSGAAGLLLEQRRKSKI